MTAIRPLISENVSYRIDLACSNRILEQKVREYNLKQSNRGNLIKSAPAAMGEKLIRLYKQYFRTWQAQNGFSYKPGNELPYLEVNNQFLSDIMQCSERTVRNYRVRLVSLGLIQETVFHGTNAPFELRINPEFLHFCTNLSLERVPVFSPMRQSLPHTSTGYKEKELLKGTVSGKICKSETEPQTGTDAELKPEPTGTGKRNETSSNTPPAQETTGTTPPLPAAPPTAPPPPDDSNPGQQEMPDDDPDQPLREKAAKALLHYVLPRMYPGANWTTAQKWAILAAAMRLFSGVPRENLGKCLENYSYRATLAAFWYERETGNPLPAPTDFFNPDNSEGIRLTKTWPKDTDRFYIPSQRRLPSPVLGNPTTRKNSQVSLYDLLNG
jgi:hypothetical protein